MTPASPDLSAKIDRMRPIAADRTDPPGDVCITCGDVAVALEVVSVEGADAWCRADDGGTELVAVELVAPVAPGDRVLVHARVALEKLP